MYKPTPHFAIAGVIAALIVFGLIGVANAQTVPSDSLRITYVNATNFVPVPPDTVGKPIPLPPDATSLKGVRIQRSIAATCSNVGGAFGAVEETVNVNVPATVFTFANLRPAGRHCVRIASVLLNDTVGPWSPVLSKNIVLPAPPKALPPTFTVE